MTAKILILEDEKEFNDLLALYLRDEGVAVDQAYTAEEAEAFVARDGVYDLILLDLNLPGKDGFEFLTAFRRRNSSANVLVISAREADEDVIMALGLGADQYLAKPLSPKTLVARVRAVLRRARETEADGGGGVYEFGPYRLYPLAYSLTKKGEGVSLSRREFEVLRYLVQHAGEALPPQKIYSDVWENEFGDITAVGTYIRRLRLKIEENAAEPVYIVTVRGWGYRFESGADK